jgi:tetratricopeptide (TPR) repeat protein
MIDMINKRKYSTLINDLFMKEEWIEARKIILKLLRSEPNDHFLFTRLSTTYFEEKKYKKALEYVQKALRISPHCPLVLWDYAGTLDMLGRSKDALKVYKSLLKMGVSRLGYGEDGEGVRYARTMINDCRYRIGLLYASMGKFYLSSKYIKLHIATRSRNCLSIYNLRKVKKQLSIILIGKDPRNC